jgi:hypothetical protein
LATVHQALVPSFPNARSIPSAVNLCRANAGKSAHHSPALPGLKHAAAEGASATKAALTSSPTSKALGPMHGPSHANKSLRFAKPVLSLM